MERRLAAILVADMVGYSRLMEQDEAGTHAALKAYREDFIDPQIAEHHGRLVKWTGDGALLEFPSAFDAVVFAVAFQHGMAERNRALSRERQLVFRIGINVGDTIIDDDEIYGNNVNVAVRLETIAEPGEICVSRTVFNYVKNRCDVGYEYLGEKTVKNIAEPVVVYRILTEPEAAGKVLGQPRKRSGVWTLLVVAASLPVLLLAGGLLLWFAPWAQNRQEVVENRSIPARQDKPSIAVLPFANLSGDPAQEYFAHGISDDLITDLSKISGLFVIARNSALAYKDRSIPARQVGKELGVRYLLEGSVRRSGDQVRVNAMLTDTTTGGQLWAERYNGSLSDVFTLQDQMTQKIVTALAVRLTALEGARQTIGQTNDPRAYDAFLQGWAHFWRRTPEDYAKAAAYLEQAIEKDPDYSRAHATLAAVYWKSWDNEWTKTLGVSRLAAMKRVEQHLETAMKNPTPLALMIASEVHSEKGQHDESVATAERAITLDPNNPVGYLATGVALIYAGRPAEAQNFIRAGMKLDPHASNYLLWLGLAQFGMERFAEAALSLERVTSRNPADDWGFLILAATYGHLGRLQEARAAIETFDGMSQERREWTSNRLPYAHHWRFKQPRDRKRLRIGLAKAGVP